MTTEKLCEVQGCAKAARAGGKCPTHYQRARRGKAGPALAAPLRGEPGAPTALVKLLALAVSQEAKDAVEAEAGRREVGVSEVMREIIEAWAKRQAKKAARA